MSNGRGSVEKSSPGFQGYVQISECRKQIQEPLLFIVLCHANGFDPLTMPPIHRIWITCTRRCQLLTKDGLHR